MDYVCELKKVRKVYPGFTLKDISFGVPKGYIMGLIGPNGAGKTTLIRLIMNLISTDAGEISLFGLDHAEYEMQVKSRIGFVYDTPPCYNYLRLKEYKSIVASFYRCWNESNFIRIATEFELPLKRKVRALSRGMKMKFSLALALSHEADFIIMDEPTSGLDPVFRRELLDKLAEILLNEDKSILLSTHITSDLERIADFITFIRDGEIVFSTTKDEILENWAVIKGSTDRLEGIPGGIFEGYRKGKYGFEGLTSNVRNARKIFSDKVIIEKPRFEDIMYYLVEGRDDA